MKNAIKLIGLIALIIFLFVTANYIVSKDQKKLPNNLSNRQTDQWNLEPGSTDVAPDFTLNDLNGRPVSLSSFKGKYVLVNFWTTWCGPCRAEMPNIQSFHQNNKDLVILAVNLNEDPVKVKQFIESNKYTFPVLLDTSGTVGDQYRVTSIPASFFINKDGKIVQKHVGSMEYEDIQNYLKKLKENK